jgi:hypothetical protein
VVITFRKQKNSQRRRSDTQHRNGRPEELDPCPVRAFDEIISRVQHHQSPAGAHWEDTKTNAVAREDAAGLGGSRPRRSSSNVFDERSQTPGAPDLVTIQTVSGQNRFGRRNGYVPSRGPRGNHTIDQTLEKPIHNEIHQDTSTGHHGRSRVENDTPGELLHNHSGRNRWTRQLNWRKPGRHTTATPTPNNSQTLCP